MLCVDLDLPHFPVSFPSLFFHIGLWTDFQKRLNMVVDNLEDLTQNP